MIYNLFLNSTTNTPLTNYFSTIDAANRGQRIYAVDWSFLPDNKKYKVTFRFSSSAGTFTSNTLLFLTADLGPTPNSVTGGSLIRRNNNNILGILKVRQGTVATNDLSITNFPTNNEPVFLDNRPNNNFLEVKLQTTPSTQFNLAVDYLMILSFEECD